MPNHLPIPLSRCPAVPLPLWLNHIHNAVNFDGTSEKIH